jgi:phosphoribosylglycinamide formyltransferase 1
VKPEPNTAPAACVVLLAGKGDPTDIVANFLDRRVPELVVVVEDSPSRLRMARRRARRVGWLSVIGQVLFVTVLQPALQRQAANRRLAIRDAASVDATHRPPDYRVASVNHEETVRLLDSLRPTAVVLQGTRIVAASVLDSLTCPVINMHAGITPRYRGVHGGYWALVEGHPEWVGSTVHLVDAGIDTGQVLAQVTFEVTDEDTFATYPDLHVVHGLPPLGTQIERLLAGEKLDSGTGIAPGSSLYYHPTLWGYLWRRWRRRLR